MLAFVDPCCAGAYSPTTLQTRGLGGTEATVLRVSTALATQVRIVHFQHHRDTAEETVAGTMLPLEGAFAPRPSATFVVINSWKVACKLRKAQPQARILLWLHVHPGRHNRPMGAALRQADIEIVCVSGSHAGQLRAFLGQAAPKIDHIHNPIADDLVPDGTPRDRNRLLFASSPHKGLAQVFERFRTLRRRIPELTLAVADPGYLAWDSGTVPEGVIWLGPLPHAALIAEMRRALCLFYPQTTFAETFGLVLAEANAVGLPVLVHRRLGANDEVAHGPGQCIDASDDDAIHDRVQLWRHSPPVVHANPDFRLHGVAGRWAQFLRLENAAAPCRQVA